jgi:hypothetical protein
MWDDSQEDEEEEYETPTGVEEEEEDEESEEEEEPVAQKDSDEESDSGKVFLPRVLSNETQLTRKLLVSSRRRKSCTETTIEVHSNRTEEASEEQCSRSRIQGGSLFRRAR